MALGDPYIDVSEFKDYLLGTSRNMALSGGDAQYQDAISTASREIDSYCARQFNRVETPSARTFEPDWHDWSYVDDFYLDDDEDETDIVVKLDPAGDGSFTTTLTPSQFELSPANRRLDEQPWPFYKIRLLGGTRFPCSYGGRSRVLQVTAKWGWQETPAPVISACKIMAAETWKLKDAPVGILGMNEFGVVRVRQNKLAVSKLAPYSKTRLLIG
jgi:hypothetical protein